MNWMDTDFCDSWFIVMTDLDSRRRWLNCYHRGHGTMSRRSDARVRWVEWNSWAHSRAELSRWSWYTSSSVRCWESVIVASIAMRMVVLFGPFDSCSLLLFAPRIPLCHPIGMLSDLCTIIECAMCTDDTMNTAHSIITSFGLHRP